MARNSDLVLEACCAASASSYSMADAMLAEAWETMIWQSSRVSWLKAKDDWRFSITTMRRDVPAAALVRGRHRTDLHCCALTKGS